MKLQLMTKYLSTGTWTLKAHLTADSSQVSRQHSLAGSVARSKRGHTEPSSKSCSVTQESLLNDPSEKARDLK